MLVFFHFAFVYVCLDLNSLLNLDQILSYWLIGCFNIISKVYCIWFKSFQKIELVKA